MMSLRIFPVLEYVFSYAALTGVAKKGITSATSKSIRIVDRTRLLNILFPPRDGYNMLQFNYITIFFSKNQELTAEICKNIKIIIVIE